MRVTWIPAGESSEFQLAPVNTDENGIKRDLMDNGNKIAFGTLEWVPFLDDKPAPGALYRGGLEGPRGAITLPLHSWCSSMALLRTEIDRIDRIFSNAKGQGTLRVYKENGTDYREAPCYRVSAEALYFSPDEVTGAYGDPDIGYLKTELVLASSSPYFQEPLVEYINIEVDDEDSLFIENDSGVEWRIYMEATPVSGTQGYMRITNENAGTIWGFVGNVDDDQVLKVDWYGTDEDALSVVLADGADEDTRMGGVAEYSDLILMPGMNALKFSLSAPWNVSIQIRRRYKSV